ncbi:hypothetical protein H4I96_12160 [Botrytis cinerea]
MFVEITSCIQEIESETIGLQDAQQILQHMTTKRDKELGASLWTWMPKKLTSRRYIEETRVVKENERIFKGLEKKTDGVGFEGGRVRKIVRRGRSWLEGMEDRELTGERKGDVEGRNKWDDGMGVDEMEEWRELIGEVEWTRDILSRFEIDASRGQRCNWLFADRLLAVVIPRAMRLPTVLPIRSDFVLEDENENTDNVEKNNEIDNDNGNDIVILDAVPFAQLRTSASILTSTHTLSSILASTHTPSKHKRLESENDRQLRDRMAFGVLYPTNRPIDPQIRFECENRMIEMHKIGEDVKRLESKWAILGHEWLSMKDRWIMGGMSVEEFEARAEEVNETIQYYNCDNTNGRREHNSIRCLKRWLGDHRGIAIWSYIHSKTLLGTRTKTYIGPTALYLLAKSHETLCNSTWEWCEWLNFITLRRYRNTPNNEKWIASADTKALKDCWTTASASTKPEELERLGLVYDDDTGLLIPGRLKDNPKKFRNTPPDLFVGEVHLRVIKFYHNGGNWLDRMHEIEECQKWRRGEGLFLSLEERMPFVTSETEELVGLQLHTTGIEQRDLQRRGEALQDHMYRLEERITREGEALARDLRRNHEEKVRREEAHLAEVVRNKRKLRYRGKGRRRGKNGQHLLPKFDKKASNPKRRETPGWEQKAWRETSGDYFGGRKKVRAHHIDKRLPRPEKSTYRGNLRPREPVCYVE